MRRRRGLDPEFNLGETARDNSGKIAGGILAGMILLAGIVFVGSGGGFRRIDAGEIGVRFNAASGESLAIVNPRLEFYKPTERLITYPSSLLTSSFVRAQREGDRPDADDSVTAATASGTSLSLDISVSWRVQPDAIQLVFANFGEQSTADIAKNYLRPLTYAAANLVTGSLTVDDILVQKRGELSGLIRDQLVSMVQPLGITVDDVNVGEIYPPAEVTQAIEGLIKARNDLQLLAKQEQTAREEAKKIITDAQRQAEESRLLSLLGDKAIQAKKLEIDRLRVSQWNGSEAIVGPKR